jgi:hypothetical protein
MNWQRGVFRLWAVASLAWVAAVIWLRYRRDLGLPDPPPGFRIDGGLRDWSFWLETVIPPPFLVGVLCLLAGWVVGGFRKPILRRLEA